jgi:hypothetical protein
MSCKPRRPQTKSKVPVSPETTSIACVPLDSLAEAKSYSDAMVRLAGDYGSIAYLTCPARLVHCSAEQLNTLLNDLDLLFFPSYSASKVIYERWVPCEGTPAGVGDELMLYSRLEPFDLYDDIRSVLSATVPRLPRSTEEMLRAAKSVQPEEYRWPWRLAFLYKAQAETTTGRYRQAELAAKSLAEFETALRLGRLWSDSWLLHLPELALMAGRTTKARNYALWLIRSGWQSVAKARHGSQPGEYIHRGNIVLGRIALAANDLQQAKAHLIEAGKAPWVISNEDKQPDMTLVADLLDRGERGAVIEYLKLCHLIWKVHADELSARIEAVRNGVPFMHCSRIKEGE